MDNKIITILNMRRNHVRECGAGKQVKSCVDKNLTCKKLCSMLRKENVPESVQFKVYNEYWTGLTAWFWFLFRYRQEARHRCRHMPSWSLSKVVVDVSFSGTHVDVKGWIEVGGPKMYYGLFKRMYVDEQVQTRPARGRKAIAFDPVYTDKLLTCTTR